MQVTSASRTDALVHWTGRGKTDEQAFGVLSAIVEELVLRLTYCPTYVRPELQRLVMMACFTDLPVQVSAEHCEHFGRCGIAFKKDVLMRYGANPVFYTTEKHSERIKLIARLCDRMCELEKDREWRSGVEPYSFYEDETVALLESLGFLQEHSYKNRDQSAYVTYLQREWRLTHGVLPFAGDGQPQLPGMGSFYRRDNKSYGTVAFAPEDLLYIVVPRQFTGQASSLASCVGCELKIYEDEVNR
jgi:hypothetical protein